MTWLLQKIKSGNWDTEISFNVNDEEIILLAGRNGAGKTTLLNTIAGLVPIKSGKLFCNNIDLTAQDELIRIQNGIGIALEGRKVFGRLSVKKNLLLGAYL